MPNSTLGALTAATTGTGGLFYGTQSGNDRKFTFTAAGATLLEAADAAAQRTALSVLALSGGTLTGALINSTNGAASAPVVSITGTTFTGGTATTTKPTLIVEPSGTTSTGWSTNGTLIGGNAATGFVGNLLDVQLSGSSRFKVASTGTITVNPNGAIGTLETRSIINVTGGTGGIFMGTSWIGLQPSNAGGFVVVSPEGLTQTNSGYIGWSSNSFPGYNALSADLVLYRTAGASLQMGTSLASGWLNQTFAAAGGRIGTDTNNSPTNTLTIAGSISTGTGTGGNLRLGVYGTNGTSGTAIGTLNTVLTVVAARKVINLAGIPTSSTGLSSGDVYSNAGILTIVP